MKTLIILIIFTLFVVQCAKEDDTPDPLPEKDLKSECLEDQMMLWEDGKCIKKYKRGYLEPGEGFYPPFTKDLPFDEKRLYESLVRIKIEIDPSNDALTPKQKNEMERHGTGFFVSSNGYLFTAYHVIRHCLDKKARSSEHINVSPDFFKCSISFQTFTVNEKKVQESISIKNFKIIYLPSYNDALNDKFNDEKGAIDNDSSAVKDFALLKLDYIGQHLELNKDKISVSNDNLKVYGSGLPIFVYRQNKYYPDVFYSQSPRITMGLFSRKIGNTVETEMDITKGISGGPLVNNNLQVEGVLYSHSTRESMRKIKGDCGFTECIYPNANAIDIREIIKIISSKVGNLNF